MISKGILLDKETKDMKPKSKTDKEIIEQLEFVDNYEAAYRLKELKKENANLKRELTKLNKGRKIYFQKIFKRR